MSGTRTTIQVVLVCVVIAATAGITWYLADQHFQRQAADDNLQPIAFLLAENRKIIDSLKADGYVESESAILETYLAKIRKDGVAKNSAIKQRIDTLVNNNTVIVALLSKFSPHARTPEFRAVAAKFADYASSLRDRWQSVFEIFMAGGNLPVAGPEYPAQLASVLNQELHD